MTPGSDDSGLDAVRSSTVVAAPDFGAAEAAAADEAGASGTGRMPLLPQPCPVTPLGVQGTKIFFLDRLNQIQSVTTECRKNDMKAWFGDGWLLSHYEEQNKDGKPTGKFNQDRASTALIEDCVTRGIFSPEGRVFGRGAHRARDNEDQLVLHMGSRVMIAGKGVTERGKPVNRPVWHATGRVGDSYFPALGDLPPPAEKPSDMGTAKYLLDRLGDWYWVDQASPVLLLGMIGQMFICGALNWRTHVWLAGPTASGKTSLQKIIRAIHGQWALHTEDATEAALRQVLRDDTLPVLIDEAEAHDNPERQRQIVNLMKKASSGAKMHRGSADHKHSEFTAQSCFLLSSVLHATMRGEDRNRIAILEMRAVPPPEEGAEPLELDLPYWRKAGREMHRRMIEHWPRFDATLQAYQAEIVRHRFEGRWGDTYGTLLACADLLLYDRGIHERGDGYDGAERVRAWVTKVLPLMARGKVEARSDVERAQMHLMTHLLPGSNGNAPESVGWWLDRAMTLRPGQFETEEGEVDEAARRKLKSHGLRVVALSPRADGKFGIADARVSDWAGSYLAVAYQTNKALAEIFRGSEWAEGGWLQSLGKIPGVIKGHKVRFNGPPDNVLLVPLTAFQGEEG